MVLSGKYCTLLPLGTDDESIITNPHIDSLSLPQEIIVPYFPSNHVVFVYYYIESKSATYIINLLRYVPAFAELHLMFTSTIRN